MPRGGMCKTKNIPACHPFARLRAMAERVYDASFVAARHQRSISYLFIRRKPAYWIRRGRSPS
jgi:hypothetical protein